VRLQDGVSDKAAGRRAATIGWAPASDTPLRLRIELRPFGVTRRGDDARPLYVLLGVVAVMMLIVCANVATLLLADARDRQAEFALRAALGASRVRLIRERLFETALLAGAGGLGGVICAATGVRFLPPLLPDGLLFGVWGGVVLDHRVLAFSLASTVATVFCAGLLPGWRSATAEHAVLKPGSYSVTTDRRHRAVHGGFVVAQLALSLVLVVSGVLLGQTLERLVRVDRGFNGGNLASVVLTVPRWKYSSSPARWDHLERVASRLRMLPGVIDVTASGGAPPTLGSLGMDAILESADGGIVPNGLLPALPFTEIEPNYFDVLRIPIVAGRRFDHSEMDRPSDAVIISASLARRIWPDGRAVAKRWRTDSGEPWMTVVGVAGDVYWFDYAAPRERYAYYVPRTRAGGVGPVQSLVVRVGGDPREALGAIRRQVAGVDPDQPVSKMGTMDDEYAEFFKAPRFAALIVSAFAGMSLVIASIGLYGVLAHAVARRRREFGIRLAIGATPADVARLVVGQGAFVVACGIVAGGTLAAATTRLLGSMLVDLSPLDPLSFGLAAAVLASVALVACSVPAARARRIEPSTLLRAE
jgi:putative ABC transport system permease protein